MVEEEQDREEMPLLRWLLEVVCVLLLQKRRRTWTLLYQVQMVAVMTAYLLV